MREKYINGREKYIFLPPIYVFPFSIYIFLSPIYTFLSLIYVFLSPIYINQGEKQPKEWGDLADALRQKPHRDFSHFNDSLA